MTKIFKSLTFLLLIITILSSPVRALEDAIIAIVNDEVITLKDLEDYIRTTYVSLVAEGMPDSQLQEVMSELEVNGLNKLIEDKLILSTANEIGLVVRDKVIDEKIEEVKLKYSSEQVFMDSLIKHGATLTDLKDKIVDQFKIQYVIDHQVRAKIFVNPQEVTDYYEENIEQFKRSDRVNLESVFISYNKGKGAAQTKAKEARKLISEGQPFREVVEIFSDAPSIGIIEKGQLLPEIEMEVFNMNEGDISRIFEVDSGIYIFKLVGKIPAETASLKDVNDTIKNLLFSQKFKAKFHEWLDNVKKDAYIEIKP